MLFDSVIGVNLFILFWLNSHKYCILVLQCSVTMLRRLFKQREKAEKQLTLESATLVNTPKFGLETHGNRTRVRVIDVYDGDTVTIAMEFHGTISSFRARLAHIDTPELKPSLNAANRTETVARANAARQYLMNLTLGQIVWVDILGYEKYGRLLIDLFLGKNDSTSVNQKLVTDGYAVSYEGGTHPSP